MTEYREGQEVEVEQMISTCGNPNLPLWRKAKIVGCFRGFCCHRASFALTAIPNGYEVEFRDGTRAVFDAEHIRAVRQSQTQLNRAAVKRAQEAIELYIGHSLMGECDAALSLAQDLIHWCASNGGSTEEFRDTAYGNFLHEQACENDESGEES